MANTIKNVMTGVYTLGVREPNDALAEWSTTQKYAGDRSVRLYKGGSGNAGSTHFELTITPSATITTTTVDADPTDFSFWYYYSAVTGNFIQFELRFEDPNSDAWAEVTCVPHQATLGVGPTTGWQQLSLALTTTCGLGGVGETGTSFFDWDLGTTLADLTTDLDGQAGVTDSTDWQLARVRLELWETEPERTAYVDSIEIDGTVYTIEPGGTSPAMRLSSPFTDIGYTKDGLTITYTADTADIEVEEETFPIAIVLTKESAEVTCNMAESTLANINNAMGGGVLSGSILTLGGGTIKTLNLKLTGLTPDGYLREIFIPNASATGAVGIAYKKGEQTVIPVTWRATKPEGSSAVTIVDNVA